MVAFFLKDQTVKILKINEVYGVPLLRLVHYRHLRLNLTAKDLFDGRRQT